MKDITTPTDRVFTFVLFSVPIILLLIAGGATDSHAAKLKNNSFETGNFSDWSVAGENWRVSNWKYDHKKGRYGAVTDVFTNEVTDEYRIITQCIKASAGKTYRASAWIRALQVEASESFIEVQFLNKKDEVLKQLQSRHVKHDQGFKEMVIDNMLAPEDTKQICIKGVVHIFRTPEMNTDYHIFDQFSVKKIPNRKE